ncbi:hypothetical protein BIY24_15590 [Halobacteriovorax marinus]|uniref:aKG-HExxH-type peptide beta-hydroxylase n=1 Tax=Halobacteriovorax marinus TaxID=97084 RepID=UPI000BC35677|nr:HEXXH motif-containing putative peptide modification protein [Halobacteriovorax marinus]ATH09314.1 hypothetical protein BIY24_15590 [Halobacteriovorax marinus]
MISSNSWILGDSAVQKLGLISSKYREQYKIDKGIQNFTPWYEIKGISSEDLLKLSSSEGLLIQDNSTLQTLKRLASGEKGDFGNLGVSGRDFYIGQVSEETKVQNQDVLTHARELISKSVPWVLGLEGKVLYHVVPINTVEAGLKAGFSTIDMKGVSFFTIPAKRSELDIVDFAIDYVHELGHQSLFMYQMSDKIFVDGHQTPIFSPIKNKERPAILAFHALCAIAFMKYFLVEGLNKNAFSESQSVYAKKKLIEMTEMHSVTLEGIQKSNLELTKLGNLIFEELRAV